MANPVLKKNKIAFVVTDGFERVELDDAGATTVVVSPKRDHVRSWEFTEWGNTFSVDVPLDSADAQDFDACAARRCAQSGYAAHHPESCRLREGVL